MFKTDLSIYQRKIRNLRNEVYRLRKKGQTFRKRLENAEKINERIALKYNSYLSKPAQLFFSMQKQSKYKPKGRRFSIDEKILALSLFKKSPKCYKLLYKLFTLPSSKSMKRLLSKIKICSGINPVIFEKIKKTLKDRDIHYRLCSLIFDEMSITPQIFYNSQKDEFEGFSNNQENAFTDHVLVFMVKGIKYNFKQPIAYFFTNNLKKDELEIMIKMVIEHSIKAGLIITNTVCDQSSVNVGAIKSAITETKAIFLRQNKQWRHDIFCVKGQQIIPLFDTPHLIKGLRNNLLTKDLKYTVNNEDKVIKWEYFEMVYKADKSYNELRLLDKITEEHINPDKINKMRVKTATQLFSHSMAVVTEHLTARGDLPEDCRQLVEFVLIIDNLFDSLNISSLNIPNGKIYKGPVKRNSLHHQLWLKAKEFLKTVKYIQKTKVGDKIRLTEKIVPSTTNLIKTIEGMEALWNVLSGKYGLDAMLTRNLNQDPLENFFGNIRSYGIRNVAPNTNCFESAFKALLVNNFNSPLSNSANCEEDVNECLQNLDFFIKEKTESPVVSEVNKINLNLEIYSDQSNCVDAGQSNYVCGWVVRKCLKAIVKRCKNCRQVLLDNTSSNKNNNYIISKEYANKHWLCYPSEEIEKCFKEVNNIVTSVLMKNVPKKHIKKTIISFLDLLVEYPFNCQIHKDDLKKYFLNVTINVLLYSWCRSVNRILQGKLKYFGEDEIKNAAQNYYNKHKGYKNKK